MDHYCDVCEKHIKPKSKYKHFKSKSREEFDKCKHISLSLTDIDVNDLDEAFYLYIIEHNKLFDFFPVKGELILVFNENQYCTFVTSKLFDNKTLIPWKIWLEEIIDGLKNKGYIFNQIAEMHIITNANKKDLSYDFYIKHNMNVVERKLNAMINKNKNLINFLNRNRRHPLNRKFENYRVWLLGTYCKTFFCMFTCYRHCSRNCYHWIELFKTFSTIYIMSQLLKFFPLI